MSFTPRALVNTHQIRIKDKDVGLYIKEVDVPTGKAFVWCVVYMLVQTSGSLRIGEQVKIGNAVFEVTAMIDGWYEISTSEIKMDRFEIWGVEMLIEQINCKV